MDHNITIEELKKTTEMISFEDYSTYLSSYPIILNWVQNQTVDEEFLVIASHVVYGWMPRVLTFKNGDVIPILKKAKTNDVLENFEIEKLKNCINGSLVGVSKLLHFINHEVYPIWDSNVYCALFGKLPNHNQISKIEAYRNYKKDLDDLLSNPDIKEVTEEVNKKLIAYYELYPIDAEVALTVSKMRAMELILFTTGKALATKIKEEKKANKKESIDQSL